MLFYKSQPDIRQLRTTQILELSRRRLLGYAETFEMLARSFGGNFEEAIQDRQQYLEKRRLWENRQVICSNFAEVAQIINHVAEETLCCEPMENKKKKLIVSSMREEGIYIDDICYLPQSDQRRAIVITMHTGKKNECPSEEVADMLSVLLDCSFQVSVNSPYVVEHRPASFLFVKEPEFLALTGFSHATKEGESISGDNYAILESDKGQMTLLLSDGTGSGEQADKDSEWVLDLMEKMLEAGYGLETAVNLVNGAIFAKGEEQNHPTLDICDLDLYQGSCVFCKVGGAASFLKRGNTVEQMTAETLPLGVFQNVELKSAARSLQNGDYLIMMTDGVLDALGKENYEEAMGRAIRQITKQNPREIAEELLQLVLHSSGGRILDDMTILVTGVWSSGRENQQ